MPPKNETPAAEPVNTTPLPSEELIYVVDTTAKSGPRTHDVEVKGLLRQLQFHPGKPQALPFYVAMKFLRHKGFIRTDEKGNPIEMELLPRQPGDLEAGEKLVLTPDQTVARLSELTHEALTRRAVLLPKGDDIATRPDVTREELAAFIAAETARIAKANQRSDGMGEDEFTPPPLSGEDFDAAA